MMKQAKRGRPRLDPLAKARRDFRIIAEYDYTRRGLLGSALDHYRDDVIRDAFAAYRAAGHSPKKAEKTIAAILRVDIGRIQRALTRKLTPTLTARKKAAAAALSSESEVARVLADRERDTGELLPDD